MLAEALSALGFETRRAGDGASAIAMAAQFKPAITLLDIGLPDIDGYEVARKMRQYPGLGAMKLVAITGYGDSHHRTQSSDAGFDAHLVKPVDLVSLVDLLRTLTSDAPPV